jgi:hypothetical protein
MSTISLVGWEKFQHYKDRDPPWIKLYRDILSTESWILGTDDSRLVQIASILLAARYHNATPNNPRIIKVAAALDMSEQQIANAIKLLSQNKFIEIHDVDDDCEHHASNQIATCASEAEQSRAEADKSAPRKRGSRIPPDDWTPGPELRAKIVTDPDCAGVDIDSQLRRFVLHEFDKGRSDWSKTFWVWCKRAKGFDAPRGTPAKLDAKGKPQKRTFSYYDDNSGATEFIDILLSDLKSWELEKLAVWEQKNPGSPYNPELRDIGRRPPA